MGFDEAEQIMSTLIEQIHKILISSQLQEKVKYYALLFLKILTSVSDNISQNTMVIIDYIYLLYDLVYSRIENFC